MIALTTYRIVLQDRVIAMAGIPTHTLTPMPMAILTIGAAVWLIRTQLLLGRPRLLGRLVAGAAAGAVPGDVKSSG